MCRTGELEDEGHLFLRCPTVQTAKNTLTRLLSGSTGVPVDVDQGHHCKPISSGQEEGDRRPCQRNCSCIQATCMDDKDKNLERGAKEDSRETG
ncbi:hypothetical protein BgiBS90_009165 [Biomphalaria glabrata]|nr:hypothetical protein BgiBS90_009165 [Biomphalaria glabrata]